MEDCPWPCTANRLFRRLQHARLVHVKREAPKPEKSKKFRLPIAEFRTNRPIDNFANEKKPASRDDEAIRTTYSICKMMSKKVRAENLTPACTAKTEHFSMPRRRNRSLMMERAEVT